MGVCCWLHQLHVVHPLRCICPWHLGTDLEIFQFPKIHINRFSQVIWLFFCFRKAMKSLGFCPSSPCRQDDELVAPTHFPLSNLELLPQKASFSPLGLLSYVLGDAHLTRAMLCCFPMQRLGWNSHHCSVFHLSPQQMLPREYLACVPRLPSSAQQQLWRGFSAEKDLELLRRFDSRLGFYFDN